MMMMMMMMIFTHVIKNVWNEDSNNIHNFTGTLEQCTKSGGCSIYCQEYEANFILSFEVLYLVTDRKVAVEKLFLYTLN
jgi:hypothetical protein